MSAWTAVDIMAERAEIDAEAVAAASEIEATIDEEEAASLAMTKARLDTELAAAEEASGEYRTAVLDESPCAVAVYQRMPAVLTPTTPQ
jgi:hypothetical protein